MDGNLRSLPSLRFACITHATKRRMHADNANFFKMFSSIQFLTTAVCAGRATLHPLPTGVFEPGCSRLTDGVASSIATDSYCAIVGTRPHCGHCTPDMLVRKVRRTFNAQLQGPLIRARDQKQATPKLYAAARTLRAFQIFRRRQRPGYYGIPNTASC